MQCGAKVSPAGMAAHCGAKVSPAGMAAHAAVMLPLVPTLNTGEGMRSTGQDVQNDSQRPTELINVSQVPPAIGVERNQRSFEKLAGVSRYLAFASLCRALPLCPTLPTLSTLSQFPINSLPLRNLHTPLRS
jgi:hypothetical protein